ncbi:MAG: EAL domain-containing protein [Rubrivivax sp.]|nr:EAL domain-containing protein [Rubrivivax sp.]
MTEGSPSLPGLLAASAPLYDDAGADAGRLRAALLGAVLRLTPPVMAANMGCALIIVWAFSADGAAMPAGMVVWAALMVGMAAVALRGWWRGRGKAPETVSRGAVRRATLHAGALASLWAVVPLAWFPGAAPHQQVQIAIVVTGMMGAGAFLLNPLPRACLAYLGIYSAAAVGSLLIEGNPAHAGIIFMIAFYASVLALGALTAGHKHLALLRSQAETARQQRMLALLLQDFEQHADEALWQTDAPGRLVHASPRLAELLGSGDAVLVGRPLLELLDDVAEPGREALRRALADLRSVRDLPLRLTVAGAERHLVLRAKRIFGDDGAAEGWRGVLADVTERVLGQQRLHALAHTDALTGLANRLTLRDALDGCLREGRRGALLLLDLDHFKGINDTLGHTAGDELLCGVAQRLRDCLRPGDLVARLGGDEFAVLMRHGGRHEDAEALAARLVGAIATPFELQGRRLRIGTSLGVAPFGADSTTADELFVQADTALYAAKEAGRGHPVFFAPTLGERNRRRLAIERGLGQALQRGELSLHWQPKVDIATWRIVGAEALLRWDTPVLGPVGPAEFIGIAEQCGLIEPLGRFALQRACAEAAGLLPGLAVSVNVSPVQLRQASFVDFVREVLRDTGLPPTRLELEVTEALFDEADAEPLQRLLALRDLGVRVALDDFGSGPSSLACLRRFPFDTLKIDPDFVRDTFVKDDARAIVQTLSRLAGTLHMRTVCEGVETAPQLAAVSAAGCEQMQGFLAAPPRPLAQFSELLRQWPGERPRVASLH